MTALAEAAGNIKSVAGHKLVNLRNLTNSKLLPGSHFRLTESHRLLHDHTVTGWIPVDHRGGGVTVISYSRLSSISQRR